MTNRPRHYKPRKPVPSRADVKRAWDAMRPLGTEPVPLRKAVRRRGVHDDALPVWGDGVGGTDGVKK